MPVSSVHRSPGSLRGLIGTAALVLLPSFPASCTSSLFEYEGELRMDNVPASYRQWFSEAVSCAGQPDLYVPAPYHRPE